MTKQHAVIVSDEEILAIAKRIRGKALLEAQTLDQETILICRAVQSLMINPSIPENAE